MSYTIEEGKTYRYPMADLFQAVLGAIEGLQGEVLNQDSDSGHIEAKFPKTIHGKVLGDRTRMELDLSETSPSESRLSLQAYPVDPVGRKLQFGARKGVTRTVLDWLYAHIDHRLGES